VRDFFSARGRDGTSAHAEIDPRWHWMCLPLNRYLRTRGDRPVFLDKIRRSPEGTSAHAEIDLISRPHFRYRMRYLRTRGDRPFEADLDDSGG